MQCKSEFLLLWFSFFYQRKGTRIVLWTEEQEQELEMLYEEFKDSDGRRKMEQWCPRAAV